MLKVRAPIRPGVAPITAVGADVVRFPRSLMSHSGREWQFFVILSISHEIEKRGVIPMESIY